jgi:hypothetical protein
VYYEIWGSLSDVAEDSVLLGCDTVSLGECVQTWIFSNTVVRTSYRTFSLFLYSDQ